MRVGTGTRITLRLIALGYLFALVAVPIGVILWRAFEPGLGTPLLHCCLRGSAKRDALCASRHFKPISPSSLTNL